MATAAIDIKSIFDFSPTDSEIVALCGKLVTKEQYLDSIIPRRYLSRFKDEEQLEYQALSDIIELFDVDMRNDRDKALKYTDLLQNKFPDIWAAYFNE